MWTTWTVFLGRKEGSSSPCLVFPLGFLKNLFLALNLSSVVRVQSLKSFLRVLSWIDFSTLKPIKLLPLNSASDLVERVVNLPDSDVILGVELSGDKQVVVTERHELALHSVYRFQGVEAQTVHVVHIPETINSILL